ncbi:glycosyl transferase [Burkholderia sp. WAC0059]|uniref:glycosyltransferase family 2 protein n=1 Tax=Burkholderia sp. WAC0059 TaxID=2066022 RepID=UPI000C7F5F0E|nr:glycosyltransferase family A protein [Burkholderia sp. WAC0059]PLZ03572.1 glycosyl transferase [Burkholderia sp. WAC0059]
MATTADRRTGAGREPQDADAADRLDIVICSYNYERFLGEAIDSALAQNPGRTRVVVVDDGSTDGSRAVIERYGDRIEAVFKENGGQASVYNLGIERVRSEYVLFLDSDDLLYAGAVDRILAAFGTDGRCAKVQFRLDVVAHDGQRIGSHVPHSMPPENCADALRRGWLYPSPPASGNAYRVSALRRVLPIPDVEHGLAADFFAIYGVALLGAVRSIDAACGAYRIHRPERENAGAQAPPGGASFGNCEDREAFTDAFPRRWDALRALVGTRLGETLPAQAIDFSYEKARWCGAVDGVPWSARWHWFLFDSRGYFRAVLGNPFWGAGKKLAALALTMLCLLPSRRLSGYAVRCIANPLSRRAAPARLASRRAEARPIREGTRP